MSRAAYQREYSRRPVPARKLKARDAARRASQRERIRLIKLDAGCTDCGYAARAEALEFDHLPDTTKLFSITDGRGRSWVAIEREMAKCEVVCANCHAIRTADRLNPPQSPAANILTH